VKFASNEVAHYYDRNTRGFLARGQGGHAGAIHRAVWAEGVRSRHQAFHYVHGLLLRELSRTGAPKPRILDLGCGVGATLSYLLERSDATGFGITNSPIQMDLAMERAGARAEFSLGDFCEARLPRAIDLAYGIESFVHASDAVRFFANVALALRPRGRLVLCDDFLAGEQTDRVQDFQRGWRASSLMRAEAIDAIAAAHRLELVEDRDLSSYLELDRPRDFVIHSFVTLGRALQLESERFMALSGGDALRDGLKRGLVSYRFRAWRKR
jgi:SAM-dependent methyltransferase